MQCNSCACATRDTLRLLSDSQLLSSWVPQNSTFSVTDSFAKPFRPRTEWLGCPKVRMITGGSQNHLDDQIPRRKCKGYIGIRVNVEQGICKCRVVYKFIFMSCKTM
jgi:hypothetical protein